MMFKTLSALVLSSVLVAVAQAGDCTTYSANAKPNEANNQPAPDFTIRGPLALDNRTGLLWTRCLVGEQFSDNGTEDVTDDSCVESSLIPLNWSYAVNQHFVAYEFNDWRLPNIKELGSIVEYCQSADQPNFNLIVFPASATILNSVGQFMWSSTPALNAPSYPEQKELDTSLKAWAYPLQHLGSGQIPLNIEQGAHVRLVRSLK